jgi:molybdenum cofactor cytidylyltransferase
MSGQDRTTVGGVILAAGQSSRYESGNKLLATIDGKSVVRHVAETACESSLSEVIAVLGYENVAVAERLDGLPLSIRHNGDYAAGQSTSVGHGVEFARTADWDAALFLLGDMPFVQAGTVEQLIDAYRSGTATIIVPMHKGQRGNPVLFDSRHFETLASVSSDRGGRELTETDDDREPSTATDAVAPAHPAQSVSLD